MKVSMPVSWGGTLGANGYHHFGEPARDEKNTLIFSGFIKNRHQLTKNTSQSDAELVLAGIHTQGTDFIKRLEGSFVIASWDGATLSLFRDGFGIKPLYWSKLGGQFSFSTHIRPLLEAGVPAELNEEALPTWLSLRYVPGPETLFKGVFLVQPGTCLQVKSDGQIETKVFYSLPDGVVDKGISRKLAISNTLDILAKSVSSAISVSSGQNGVGMLLSSGIDSAAIAALAKGHKITAFTYGMAGQINEIDEAKGIAGECGFEHISVKGRPDDFKALKDAIFALEEPLGDAVIAATWRLMTAAGAHSSVLLSGEGADELMGGYVHHLVYAKLASFGKKFPRNARNLMADAMSAIPAKVWDLMIPYPGKPGKKAFERIGAAIKSLEHPAHSCAALQSLFSPDEQRRLLTKEMAAKTNWKADAAANAISVRWGKGSDIINPLLRADLAGWNVDYNMLRMSKLAAANGIEPVFPYLDHRLVELSLTVPGDYKIKGWQRKVLLRKALNGVVSNKIRQKEKHPFTLSTCQVFDAGWTKLVSKTLSEESVRQRGWFNPLEVAKIRDAAPDNLLYDKQRAALVILELWARMYLDKASLPWQD